MIESWTKEGWQTRSMRANKKRLSSCDRVWTERSESQRIFCLSEFRHTFFFSKFVYFFVFFSFFVSDLGVRHHVARHQRRRHRRPSLSGYLKLSGRANIDRKISSWLCLISRPIPISIRVITLFLLTGSTTLICLSFLFGSYQIEIYSFAANWQSIFVGSQNRRIMKPLLDGITICSIQIEKRKFIERPIRSVSNPQWNVIHFEWELVSSQLISF